MADVNPSLPPAALQATPVPGIPGMLVIHMPVHGDNRGWFKENWQRAKMTALGLPDFGPVQNNISFNAAVGTTRGIHAEPWDKFVSVATGRIFGAWVDLRAGETFGAVFTTELDPGTAVYVPRGVGNAFQTLEPNTAYSYLVNDHWSAEATGQYAFLNLADETAAIDWPIPLEEAELSDKDRQHPRLADVAPVPPLRTLVLGAGGQLGTALRRRFAGREDVDFATRADLDLTNTSDLVAYDWSGYSAVINAGAYTQVDAAETSDGRAAAWAANATGVAALARVCIGHGLTLVHVSSDYVFDGTSTLPYTEQAALSPLGVYGQSKAAGDLAAATVPNHYLIRTSWVIGDGGNFVATMLNLATRGIEPNVVNDQFGRLSFTDTIAAGIDHLLATDAPAGTYNLTNAGEPASWADIAEETFAAAGRERRAVTGISTAEYFAGKQAAPRPLNSVLDLAKISATGFTPQDMHEALRSYLADRNTKNAGKD
ncbi:bifunctional dTDP-4-dehydrorhamnose 3,5-epimerase family protein/NAD(P)-dependent oxidoreductase [Paeniglutamicibacter sp. ABSL32-1]|uniref:sugar nucleotide-binding protein n=1 Tax=Paeniglutamicibacter quisquiliarum TaxID=2849498 RepID=UPI001C2D8812|nr:bifunctional dTDP-4-dehydrorhamnose 3,5-epimerase family protein/NAD(P)-dependent oxidoreductase [Paeniglutamicibacter quisquiliarum]MBV1780718.1 bifunctional dTDP-4-dehydrorhamnose 3,5-epimerase family protein/NAD(P)-dependent oxidoreductase [Paeniglutamicibacter quisquiliarum]